MAQTHRSTGRRLLAGAVLVFACSAALADSFTLDFDDLGYSFLGAGDMFGHKGFQLSALSGLPDSQPSDLVGAIFDGNAPGMCMQLSCPTNNLTAGYYAGLNDGALLIDSAAPGGLHIKSFDASFIGAFQRNEVDGYPDVAGVLEVRGYAADGSFVSEHFNLSGPAGTDFLMQRYETSADFASQAFTEISFFAYRCDFSGECIAFGDNAGQFALDNISMDVSPVPEPGAWLMLLGGLGTISVFRRRRAV